MYGLDLSLHTAAPVPASESPHPAMPLVAYRIDDRQHAIAAILTLLAKQKIFAATHLARVVASVTGSVERGHYFLVRRGTKPVGYCGFGLCDEAVVERHLASESIPVSRVCLSGSTMLLFDFYAADARVTRFIKSTLCRLHPGTRIAGRRTKKDGVSIRRTRLSGTESLNRKLAQNG